MEVVRFLERKSVIRFFGLALLFAPFINIGLHLLILKTQNKLMWSQVNIGSYLRSGNPISYVLMICSIIIAFKVLSGSTKAWRYVLFLISTHLLIQIINVNNKAWQGPLAWPSFLLNAGLFYFIIDQLLWKVKIEPQQSPQSVNIIPIQQRSEKQVINLKSYRKILFSFGSNKPWGELKTLSGEELAVKSFAQVPDNIENQTVQINFAKDVVVEILFSRKENKIYYFKTLNMQKENVIKLNKWLKKIAV